MSKRGFGAGLTAFKAGGHVVAYGAALATLLGAAGARAAGTMGRPTDGAIGLQPAASPLRHQAAFFHDAILMPVITIICLFVLGLLIWVVVRYNAKSNPTPKRFTHNTALEIAWTAAPVLILMFIAIFSFRLLYSYHAMPKPDLTVKVTGNQWYWNYEYPTAGDFAYDSIPLPEAKAEAKGKGLYRLAVDNPMVVPVGKTVQVLATGADVLHSFFIPAFGVQTTTIPGRINQTWFKAEREGVFYGQCNELCGVNHSFMPIEVDVVSQPAYDAWVAAHSKKTATPAGAPTVVATTAAPGGAATTGPAAGSGAGTVGPTGGTASPAPKGAAPPAAQTGPLGVAKTPA